MNLRRVSIALLAPLAVSGLLFTGAAHASDRYRVELHYYSAPPARVYYPAPVYVYRAYPPPRIYRYERRHHHRHEWRRHYRDRDDFRRSHTRYDDDGRYRMRFDYYGR